MQYSSIFFSYIRPYQRLLRLSCFHSSESIHSKRYDHHKHVKSCIKVWPTSWAKSNFRPKLMGIAKTSASYRIVGTGARAVIQNTDGRSHTNLSCWFSNGVHPLLFCWCGFKVWHCRGEKCVWLLVGKILLYTSGKSGNILYWRAIYMMGMFVANWQSWYWEEGGHQNTSPWRGWAAFPQVLLEKLLGEEMRFALWMTPGHLHPPRLSQLTFYIYLTNI